MLESGQISIYEKSNQIINYIKKIVINVLLCPRNHVILLFYIYYMMYNSLIILWGYWAKESNSWFKFLGWGLIRDGRLPEEETSLLEKTELVNRG